MKWLFIAIQIKLMTNNILVLQKIGDANRGSNSGKYGTGQKVICVNTGEIFISIHDAFLKTGISKGSISECCKGKRKSAGKLNGEKLYWKFID